MPTTSLHIYRCQRMVEGCWVMRVDRDMPTWLQAAIWARPEGALELGRLAIAYRHRYSQSRHTEQGHGDQIQMPTDCRIHTGESSAAARWALARVSTRRDTSAQTNGGASDKEVTETTDDTSDEIGDENARRNVLQGGRRNIRRERCRKRQTKLTSKRTTKRPTKRPTRRSPNGQRHV